MANSRFLNIFLLVTFFTAFCPVTAYANFTFNHGAEVTAHVTPTGGGKVYVAVEATNFSIPASGDWEDSECAGGNSSNTRGQVLPVFIYAKENPGYEFLGWSKDSYGTAYLTLNADDQSSDSDYYQDSRDDGKSIKKYYAVHNNLGDGTASYDIYARFSPITYTITYDPDGGTVSGANTQSYTIEKTDALKTATKTGVTFDGWEVTAVNGEGNWVLGETAVSPLNRKYGNVTLTAQWASADITISVSGLGSNDNAFFTVSNGDGVLYTVALSGSNPSVTIKGLPTGAQYTVQATGTWSWAYGNPSPASAVFSLGKSGYTANFTYSKNTSAKKHDEQINVNWHTPSL